MQKLQLRYTYAAIGLLLVFAWAALGWVYHARMVEFDDYHRNFAAGAVAEVASQFAFLLDERQRQVALFADDHRALLERLVRHPDDEALHTTVGERLRRSFPDYFAFVITDARGAPYWPDYDGYVGDICVKDIRTFVASRQNLARVHPNPVAYHYDVMAYWQAAAARDRILMVSFKPDQLVQKLRAVKVPGHDLMLLLADGSNLIEVTADGARTVLNRDDYRLTADEAQRIVHRQEIRGSRWQLADLFEPGFVPAHRRRLMLDMAVFLLMFMIVAAFSAALIRREEMARRSAEEARKELMAAVTHELRTPLTSLVGSLGLLAGGALGALPAKARELVEIMNRSAERLRRLVDDLLDARRTETGLLSLDLQPVELNALVDEALIQNVAYGDRFGVRFERRGECATWWVTADPIRLHQVLANLLSNAAKFSPSGSRVQVQVATVMDGWVRVSVTDHGPGVREEFRGQIFMRYAQDDNGGSAAIAGSGLGLNIVKTLVEMHEGRVGFDSEPGKGATFYFELRVMPVPPE